jgi:hypothetical protein
MRSALPHNDLQPMQSARPVQNSLNPERHDHFAPRRAKHRAIRPQLLEFPELPIMERFRTDPVANYPPPPVSLHIRPLTPDLSYGHCHQNEN